MNVAVELAAEEMVLEVVGGEGTVKVMHEEEVVKTAVEAAVKTAIEVPVEIAAEIMANEVLVSVLKEVELVVSVAAVSAEIPVWVTLNEVPVDNMCPQ